MSNVCVARVRVWAGVDACSAEGAGDGPDPAGGRLGHATIVLFYWLTRAWRAELALSCANDVRAARRPGPARRLPPLPSMHPHLPTLARAPHTQ